MIGQRPVAPKTVTAALRRALDERDGHRCAWHFEGVCDLETLVPHHRVNRGMGGRASLNRLSNLVWLCAVVNGLIESSAEWAVGARVRGIKLSGHAEPSRERVRHAVHGWCLLTDDGAVVEVGGGE